MRLTLDWDSDELKEIHLPAVRDRQPANENQQRLAEFVGDDLGAGEKWELWHSSTHGEGDSNGWHYVEYDQPQDLEDIRRLRTAYGDDRLRTSLDGDRMQNGSPYAQVLYHLKNIKPHETKPYETTNRAQLQERHWPTDEYADTKREDGSIDYPALVAALADHNDFSSRADLFRRVQQRPSVQVTTEARKRGYDIAKGRRSPDRNEAKALRDYAESRDIGHYGQDEIPEELAQKPTRTVFHEYFETPDIEFGTYDFEGEESDSDWLPTNLRTGTYGDVDETTLKQIHDRIADELTDVLAPQSEVPVTKERDDGSTYETTEVRGISNLSRWDRMISLSRDRPLDRDEKARYRKIFWNNQPGTSKSRVKDLADRVVSDPFDGSAVIWECIIYNEEYNGVWWLVRGILDADDPDAVAGPIRNSVIVADTNGWLA